MIDTLTEVNEEVLEEIKAEMELRRTTELFLLFSLGSQYDHLIKMMLDRFGVYCLWADPAQINAADVDLLQPIGIVLSGGPASIQMQPPPFDTRIFDMGIPVLGICLGFQLWAKYRGAEIVSVAQHEYGVHELKIFENPEDHPLFRNIPQNQLVMQSHSDIVRLMTDMTVLAATTNSPIAAARVDHLWGVQFHPEVTETIFGQLMFSNFCFDICGAQDQFPAEDEVQTKITQIKAAVGSKKVLLALSGGSDSSVVAYLLSEALGLGQIRAVYIRGIDRPDDLAYVQQYFGNADWLELVIVDATEQFLQVLDGQYQMHDKRLAMRGVYKDILEQQAADFGASFIAQGTLYTDITESGGGHRTGAHKARIKLHHNTGLDFSIPELTPLDDCVKDTARQIGRAVGAPEELMTRHPFPGPGLVVRIEGEIDAVKLAIARHADSIYIEELRAWQLYETVWQAGATLTGSIATVTKGDGAGEGPLLVLWAVWSTNGFTAQWAELPFDFLRRVSARLTNEIREVGSVAYRISSKPPATIEWG